MQPTQEILKHLNELARLVQSYHPADKMHYEILKRKCTELYEQILLLDDLSEFDFHEEQPTLTESQPMDNLPYNATLSMPNNPVETTDVQNNPTIEDKTASALTHQNETEENSTTTNLPVSNEPIDAAVEHPTAEKQPHADLFSTPPLTKNEPVVPLPPATSELSLHEKLSAHLDNKTVLADKLGKKVENLKAAISLNQKIAFVNILFKENVVEYAKSIEKLNQASNIDEALRYFTELKHTYDWESTNELVKELQQLIEKRFM